MNRLLIRNAVRRAAAIISPSQATAAEIARSFPGSSRRTVAIPEAADQRFFPEHDVAAEQSWQRYAGIRPPYFFYLGQWKEYKNLPLLIQAFRRVVEQQESVQLVLAGGDPRHPEVPAAIEALPRGSVVMPGHLPDDAVPELYRGAAAVVLPSRAEGFGLPVLEAMACGVPIICSDIPVLHEIADGVAIFADPTSAEAVASAMLSALDRNVVAPRISAGLERARQFSWDRAAKETIAVYERVLAGRASTRSEID